MLKILKREVVGKLKTYITSTVHELVNKVSWPTWKELQTSSVIVLLSCVILSLAIWVMDLAFGIWPENTVWKGVLGFFYEMF